ncbi:hypothetical protein [Blastococcus saxobsidens]|uniref:MinD-like ATPase involved in chromosome partitioning or flagellar assembly n=1 Tax=Blastococcus saxobsidens TaxID=138336 RepID=A0A4Q7Y249_9ACTN|nr:hypothetical protein [Blastococcus saxobsidens]RZU30867.1 hypothetical protein BKA19_0499 [Blastococcus saxobsidens]
MTVPAMRAAVVAIRAGVFDDVTDDVLAHADRAFGAAVGSCAGQPDSPSQWTRARVGGRVVLVVAGHAGAGASTVALALAEGLAADRRVQLVDYSEPARSGLSAAPTIELGTDAAGWRCGRRGRLDVVRLARHPADGALPPLPETDADATVVVDTGWSTTCALLDSPGSLVGCALVVVTRVTVPAVRQTEHVLAAVGGEAAVAAVGPARWPRLVEASCGPRLREARSTGQVVPVPFDRRLQTAGLTGDRLPKSVAAAGRALAALVAPAASPRHRRPAARTGATR